MSKGRRRSLTSREQRFLALLGLPTLGLALAITTVTTYLPLLAQRFTSSAAIIGLVIAAEGLVALVVPLVVGQWSDQLETRIGGRVPFVIAGAPLLAVAVGVMGFAGSLIVIAVLVLLFFLAYYAAYEPYRALYADTLEARVAGRGQSTQAVFRGVGTGLALVGGGVLFGLARPLPFAVAGLVALGTMGLFSWRLVRRGFDDEQHGEERSARETLVR